MKILKYAKPVYICNGRFSFVFEVLVCFALSYVLNPNGLLTHRQERKMLNFELFITSKTSDVSICLSIFQVGFQCLIKRVLFSLMDLSCEVINENRLMSLNLSRTYQEQPSARTHSCATPQTRLFISAPVTTITKL